MISPFFPPPSPLFPSLIPLFPPLSPLFPPLIPLILFARLFPIPLPPSSNSPYREPRRDWDRDRDLDRAPDPVLITDRFLRRTFLTPLSTSSPGDNGANGEYRAGCCTGSAVYTLERGGSCDVIPGSCCRVSILEVLLMPEFMPEFMSEFMSEFMPELTPEIMPEFTPEFMPSLIPVLLPLIIPLLTPLLFIPLPIAYCC